jgi:hypothetical protein
LVVTRRFGESGTRQDRDRQPPVPAPDRDAEEQKGNSVSDGDLTTTAEKFAQQVEAVLKAWHFPEADRVFFDPKTRDLAIAGKARTARGKGLRAITHAAFTSASWNIAARRRRRIRASLSLIPRFSPTVHRKEPRTIFADRSQPAILYLSRGPATPPPGT